MTDTDVKSTPLAAKHVELGARMVPFAGWNMPVQYTGILDEHKAVRETCGIFDISHMGQFTVAGDSAAAWLNSMLTNDINKLNVGQGQYSVMLNDRAGVIDDLILYRMEPETFFVVVNASKIDEDFAWLSAHQPAGVTLENHSDEYVGLAVQGPECGEVFSRVIPGVELPPRNGISRISAEGTDLIVCRTGYTGEDGFEFFCPAKEGVKWFEAFLGAGAKTLRPGRPRQSASGNVLSSERLRPLSGQDASGSRARLLLRAGYGFHRFRYPPGTKSQRSQPAAGGY